MKDCTCEIKYPATPLSNSSTVFCLHCGNPIAARVEETEAARLEKARRLEREYQEGITHALTFEDTVMDRIIQELYHMGYVMRPIPGHMINEKYSKWRLVHKDSLLPVFPEQ